MVFRIMPIQTGLIAACLVVATSATAATAASSTLTPTQLVFNTDSSGSLAEFGRSFITTGNFEDSYSFIISSLSSVYSSVTSKAAFAAPPKVALTSKNILTSNLDITGFSLFDVTRNYTFAGTQPKPSSLSEYWFIEKDLSAGNYRLDITGITRIASNNHSASYSGSVSLENIAPASAIPEPATYAMLLAGMAVVGFASIREKRKTS